MDNFILSYLGGNHPSSPEEAKQHFERYKTWLEGLGEAVVSPANPFKDTHVINPDGSVEKGSSTMMSGYTVVSAENIEMAIEMGRSCPFLEIEGKLEVSELVQMNL